MARSSFGLSGSRVGCMGCRGFMTRRRLAWSDLGWQCAPHLRARADLVYELHIGTFTAAGTFRFGMIGRRLDHLVELGITHVELMPVAAFPGRARMGVRRGFSCLRCRPIRRPGRVEAAGGCLPCRAGWLMLLDVALQPLWAGRELQRRSLDRISRKAIHARRGVGRSILRVGEAMRCGGFSATTH